MSVSTIDLEARLARLEELIADGAGGDSLSPANPVVQVTPGGTLQYGLPLLAEDDIIGTAGSPAQWQRQADGSVVANIIGDVASNANRLLALQALGSTGEYAQVLAQAILSGGVGGEGSVVLIDSNQQSAFLQIDTNQPNIGALGRMTVAAGSANATWTAGGSQSAAVTLVTTRFTNNIAIVVTPVIGSTTPAFANASYIGGTNPAQWSVRLYTPFATLAAGSAYAFSYVAFGW